MAHSLFKLKGKAPLASLRLAFKDRAISLVGISTLALSLNVFPAVLGTYVLGPYVIPEAHAELADTTGAPDNVLGRAEIMKLTTDCEQGRDVEACYTLGGHYAVLAIDRNTDIEINMKLANHTLEKSCGLGHDNSCMLLGRILGLYGNYFIDERSPKHDLAYGKQLLERACSHDDAFGCAQLGSLYDPSAINNPKDNNIKPDAATALEYYQKSCTIARGKDEAMKKESSNLGLGCYYAGLAINNSFGNKEIPKEQKLEIIANFETACELNTPEACIDLAAYYTQTKQAEKAIFYSKRACFAGNAEVCLDNAMQLQQAGNDRDSNYFLDIACQMGHGDACTLLASNMLSGIGVPQRVELALQMLGQGCDNRNGLACMFLGRMYLTGGDDNHVYTTDVDLPRARIYLDRACQLGVFIGCEDLEKVNQRLGIHK